MSSIKEKILLANNQNTTSQEYQKTTETGTLEETTESIKNLNYKTSKIKKPKLIIKEDNNNKGFNKTQTKSFSKTCSSL